MDFFVYILQSTKTNKLYVGQTSNLDIRLSIHNQGLVKSTKNGRPWIVINKEIFSSRSEAVKRERYLRSLKNPKYILEKIINHGPVV